MNRAVLTAVALLATTLAASAQPTPSQEPQGDGGGTGAMPSRQENLAASSKPLATVQSDVPGVHTDILSLQRSEGGMLTLRMAFVNDSEAPVKPRSIPGSENPVGGGMVLVDYAGKRKYSIVTFSDGTCLCNSFLRIDDFPPGTRQVWAKFASPPASVRKVSILFPNSELVDDIPIIDRDGVGSLARDRNPGGQPPSLGKAAHPRPSKPYCDKCRSGAGVRHLPRIHAAACADEEPDPIAADHSSLGGIRPELHGPPTTVSYG